MHKLALTKRIANGTVVSLPTETPTNENPLLVASDARLCPSDGGAPAYFNVGRGGLIVGVNSLVEGSTSEIAVTPVFTGPAIEFALEWSKKYGLRLCGLHGDAKGCRNASALNADTKPQCDETLLVAQLTLWKRVCHKLRLT